MDCHASGCLHDHCVSLCCHRIGGSRKRPCERRSRYDRAARRLLDAKDYASAATLLEDLLLESGAKERTEILGMLKQSYEVLAREAEAAGREREAADYRDNLAILGASQPPSEPVGPTSPRVKPPQAPRSPAVSHDEPAQPPENRPRPAGPKALDSEREPSGFGPGAGRTGGPVRARR